MTTCLRLLSFAALALPVASWAETIQSASGISTTGYIVANQVSLTTPSGTTWGYITNNASYLPNLNSNSMSTTQISIANPPVANTDAVNKAYVDTVAAASTKQCKLTSTAYIPGAVGNTAGGNSKCVSAFGAGWSWATLQTLPDISNLSQLILSSPKSGILINHSLVRGGQTFNCGNWSDTGESKIAYLNSTTGFYFTNTTNSCAGETYAAVNLPLLCCNF